jgi:hypothetical protein
LPKVGGVVGKQVTEVKPLQLENAYIPISVTPLGIISDVKLPHILNALLLITVTLSGIAIFFNDV